MTRVCLVCMGNICRSPMAEAVLRAKLEAVGLGGRVAVDSAGTGGWHAGQDADPRARRALAGRGYRLDHRARQFLPDDFASRDLVLALDRENLRHLSRIAPADGDGQLRLLRSFDPAAPPGAEVPDPYYGGDAGFEAVLDMIEDACDGLVAHLRAG